MTVTIADVGLALRRGEVLADDGSLHTTVQAAENAASSFIFIPPETFNESVAIDTAGLAVMGCGRDTLIDGGTTGSAIDIQAANVVVANLSVQTTAGQGNSFDGIIVSSGNGGDSGMITRVWVRDSDQRGIMIANGNDWLVSNCKVEGADGDGIRASTPRVIVSGCIVTDVGNNGMNIRSDDSLVCYNIVRNPSVHGIQPISNDCIYLGNRVIGAGNDGIAIDTGATDNIIANNRVSGSTNSDIDDNGTSTLLDANNTGA